MAATRADTHDLDKLDRWRKGLEEAEAGAFPAIAIFLVSEAHRLSHYIFREYRTSFETRGAEFHHLVIFGQHGISTTVTGFLRQACLDLDCLPSLALVTGPEAMQAHLVSLPTGEAPDTDAGLDTDAGPDQEQQTVDTWRVTLDRLESAADTGSASVDYSGISGVRTVDLGGLHLMGLVSELQGQG